MRNLKFTAFLLLALCSQGNAAPMTNQEAADAGKTLGQTQDALITPQINQTNADANIPYNTSNPPETQFFGGGRADNFSAGDAKRVACDTGAKNPDAFTQQSCDAVNLIAKAPSQRPQYTIGRNDPMLQREQEVRANASSVAFGGVGTANNPNGFGIAGTYSGCTTTTTPDPGTTEIKTCTDFLSATETTVNNTCQKSVSTTQTCHQVMSFTVTQATPIPATPIYSCSSGTLSGTNCTFPATSASATYSCSSGTLSGTQCYYPAYQPAGVAATATGYNSATLCETFGPMETGWGWVGQDFATDIIARGEPFLGISAQPPAYTLPCGNSCRKYGSWGMEYYCPSFNLYSCPSGYTQSGTTCYPPTITPEPTAATATYTCAAPSTLSGTSCIWPDAPASVTYTCGAGMTLSGSTCTPAPIVTETFTDNCATLQAMTK